MKYGKTQRTWLGIICLLIAGFTLQAQAQTKEKGPWWPHPIWGADDQSGGSNWITPEKVIASLKLVKTGKIYEIGQIYERGMPLFGQRTYSIFASQAGPFGKNNLMGKMSTTTALPFRMICIINTGCGRMASSTSSPILPVGF